MIHWPRKLIYAGAILFSTLAVKVFAFSNPRCSSFVQLVNTRRTLSTTLSPKHQHHVTSTVTTLAMLPPNIPSWAPYSLFHIVGGTTGTPIVVRATKSWYKRIPLPSWTPPNFVFGPVWTLLYGLMGVSVSRIVKASTANSNALNLWKVHYILNLLWAPLFFGFQYLRVGLFINVALVTTLLMVMRLFYLIDPIAAYLQVPYLLWLIYATKLNQAICKLNPVVDGINEARLQADLCADGNGYNEAMLEYDIAKLQSSAAKYAEL